MHKKIMVSLVMISMISVILSGCQLAVAEAGNIAEEDKLVGVFVTEDYIDLFDFKAFSSENSNKLMDGGEVVMDSKYEGRVYGTINENNPGDVVFEGYEGVLFIDTSYEKDGVIYSRVGSGKQVTQVHISVNDEGNSIEGTIYAKSAPIILAVLNPVYMTDDGEIYFTSGSGVSMGDENGGGSMSMFLTENHTVRVGNNESTESFKVKINIEGMDDVEYYILKQMDGHDNQVTAEKIYSHDVPSSIQVNDQTRYMMLEKIGIDYEGKPFIERQIINDEGYFHVYFFNESAFAEGHSVQLNN